MTLLLKLYLLSTIAAGALIFAFALQSWHCEDPLRLAVYTASAAAASLMKVNLPGIRGTLSLNFFFSLIAIVQLSMAETLVVGTVAFLTQYLWKTRSPQWQYAAFNVACGAISLGLSYASLHSPWFAPFQNSVLGPVIAATVYFVVNTSLVSAVLASPSERSFWATCLECYVWTFPYYMLGAWLAGMFDYACRAYGWGVTLIALPVLFGVYSSYSLFLQRLQTEKEKAEEQRCQSEEMSSLHLRTIEALALAIEAKDETTSERLQRLQIYAVETGKEMGLSGPELEALRAAALLHDIGKLAVPEHIISKPGRLTAEEFEKMKIHPVVGAEILECVKFPYDVASIVRYHHERWDGSGYPEGLKGEQIPIGARILAAVDCLDTLASDRQYRKAMPLGEAMSVVTSGSRKAFDPEVVEVLQRRYQDMEALLRTMPGLSVTKHEEDLEEGKLARVTRMHRANPTLPPGEWPFEFLQSIGAAKQEAQLLFELANELGSSLRLEDTLNTIEARLSRLIPYNTLAIYHVVGNNLVCEYASGDEEKLFRPLEIPMGEGLSGWVAFHDTPIVNGNPSVEPGYKNDPRYFSNLRAALAVPLHGPDGGVIGVITLYHAQKDFYSRDHSRILQAVGSKLGCAMKNTMAFRDVEDSATIDFLTGLGNARALKSELDRRVQAAYITGDPLAVLVGDLNGFKQVNDLLGHMEGDRVLQLTAQAIRAVCRGTDFAARTGGDEFVVILPNLQEQDSAGMAERLRVAIDGAWNVSEAGRNNPTLMFGLSVGFAFLGADGKTPEELLIAADRRMYAAKARLKETKRQRQLSLARMSSPLPVVANGGRRGLAPVAASSRNTLTVPVPRAIR